MAGQRQCSPSCTIASQIPNLVTKSLAHPLGLTRMQRRRWNSGEWRRRPCQLSDPCASW